MALLPHDLGLHWLGFVDSSRLAELVEEAFDLAMGAVRLRDDEQAIVVADRGGSADLVPTLRVAATFDELHQALRSLVVLGEPSCRASGGLAARFSSRLRRRI